MGMKNLIKSPIVILSFAIMFNSIAVIINGCNDHRYRVAMSEIVSHSIATNTKADSIFFAHDEWQDNHIENIYHTLSQNK
jgi:hypothetical protein